MSKILHRNLQAKIVALQGPEWDSSDDEQENVSQQVKTTTTAGKKKQSVAERKRAKKNKKEPGNESQKDDDEEEVAVDKEDPSIIYIGHFPSEFEETDLRTFLSQFGKVVNSRISRSVKTGGSRGYAFVKFADAEVATIVAETLQGYFLGKRRLVCNVVPDKKGMFYNTDKVIAKRKTMLQAEKKRREVNLASASKMKEITDRLVKREQKKRKKLQELGIDYDFPGYEASVVVSEKEEEVAETASQKKKKRKDSISSETSATKKSKRKDSVSSETSATKKSKRKDSISSETSATKKSKRKDSVSSETSATKKSKRKESPSSETSASKQSKRKESIGSVDSQSSKRRKRKNSEGSLEKKFDAEVEKEEVKKVPQSDKKKKKKKAKSRRLSAP